MGGQGGPGYYGQGGPGSSKYSPTTPGSSSFVTKAPRKDPDYSNMVIFPSPPGPRRGKPMTHAMTPPGQSGQSQQQQETNQLMMNNQLGLGSQPQTQQTGLTAASNFNSYQSAPDVSGSFSNVSIPSSSTSTSSSPTSSISQTVAQGLQGLSSPTTGTPSGKGGPGDMTLDPSFTLPNIPSTNNNSNASSLISGGSGISSSQLGSMYPSLLSSIPSATTPSSLSNLTVGNSSSSPSSSVSSLGNMAISPNGQLNIPKPIWDAATGTFGTSEPAATNTPSSTSSTSSNPATSTAGVDTAGANNTNGATNTSGIPGTSGTSGTPSTSGSPSSTSSTLQTSVQNGLSNNMGATGWAQSVMANQDLLKQIFPGENIPASGSLTDAVNQLKTTLQQQYNIKGLQDQLEQMTSNGVVMGPMLQTYIQNKDQSLNAIHSQILNAQNQALHVDQGNPYEVDIWNKYQDYLNNIYTAQNASYADYFNKSTTMYSNALSALNTTLTNSLNSYNNDLSLESQLTEADYNRMYQGLTDMYTAAQNAPTQSVQLATLQAQLALTNQQLLESGVTATTGQGNWTAEYKKLVDAGILFSNTKPTTSKSGNVGELLPSVTDFSQGVHTILSDNPKIGLDGAIYIMGQAMQKSLDGAGSNPDTSLSNAARFAGMIEAAVNQPNPVISSAQATDLLTQIGTTTAKSVYNSLYSSNTGGKDNTSTAKSAIIDAIVGSKGWFGLGSATVPTETQFVSKYGPTLTNTLAKEIYEAIDTQKSLITGQLKGNPGIYGQGQTADTVMQGMAQQVNSLSTPSDIANYVGQMIAALFGVSNADLTSPMNSNPNAMVSADTQDTTGTNTWLATPTDTSGNTDTTGTTGT